LAAPSSMSAACLEDANRAVDELAVARVHIDHEISVDVAERVIAPVVSMFSTIFCAVPAFIRLEPETTSGPTGVTIAN